MVGHLDMQAFLGAGNTVILTCGDHCTAPLAICDGTCDRVMEVGGESPVNWLDVIDASYLYRSEGVK